LRIFVDFECESCGSGIIDVEVDSENIPKSKKCPECGKKMTRVWNSQITIPRAFKAVTPPIEDYMD